ncbi:MULTISPECIES: hypothetical protein [Flavobacteriaceae]|uniref:hypothetical protein n=1 Tax=Flavobacteriaceae TaxID=49546 RepID=UPI00149200E0|nr:MULTISPECIES: hypothetical protein [Allomuricauda]MDC6367200.1 hypothetical protein [Muricauda sp. AC10]
MESSGKTEEHRLKVEKGLERQATILGFKLKYLAIYGAFVFLSLIPLIINGVGFSSFIVSVIAASVSYMLVKYADEKDLLEQFNIQNYPKILVNDLYKKLEDRGENQS